MKAADDSEEVVLIKNTRHVTTTLPHISETAF